MLDYSTGFNLNSFRNRITNKLTLVILMTSGLFVVSQVYILLPLFEVLENHLNVASTKIVWTVSAFSFSYAIGFIVFGPLSDFVGRRRIILIGLSLLSLTTLLIGTTNSFIIFIVLRIAECLAASTFAPAAMAYVGGSSDESFRVLGLSLLIMSFALAGVLGQVYASVFSYLLNIHWMFYILAGIYGVAFILVFTMLGESVKGKIETTSLAYKNMFSHLINPKLAPIYFVTFIILMSFVAVYSVLGNYLHQQFRLDTNSLIYIRIAGVPSMCLSPFSGLLSRKIGGSAVARIGLLVLIFGLIGESYSRSLLCFILSSMLFDAGIAIITPALVTMINVIVCVSKGAAMSLYTFFLFAGAGVGPLVDEGIQMAGFQWLCLIFIFLFTVCFLVLLYRKRC
jgi:predicted MFS family arabinose efflux permease